MCNIITYTRISLVRTAARANRRGDSECTSTGCVVAPCPIRRRVVSADRPHAAGLTQVLPAAGPEVSRRNNLFV